MLLSMQVVVRHRCKTRTVPGCAEHRRGRRAPYRRPSVLGCVMGRC